MIANISALHQEFVPSELHHREGDVTALTSALRPLVDGDVGEDVLIFGRSGVGKTTLAKFCCQKLEDHSGTQWGYANCIEASTSTALLRRLLRDGGLAHDLPHDGKSTAAYFERLRDVDGQFVAVIDEVDVLDSHDVLVSLYERQNVCMVLICVDEHSLFCDLDMRAHSRLRSSKTLTLEGYTHEQMTSILWDRAKVGLTPATINSS